MRAFARPSCITLALSLLALGVPSHAADIDEVVPEVTISAPVTNGWYVRGDLGYGWSSVRTDDVGIAGEKGGSFLLGGGIGYQATDWLRADVTVDYLTRANFEARMGDGIETRLSAVSVLANAYVDLGNLAGFTPYAGAGLGATHMDWSVTGDTGALSVDGAKNWRFTYAVMAGVSMDLSDNLKLDAGYRFRRINGGVVHDDVAGAGSITDRGLNVHDLRIGLRYAFH